MKPSFLLVATKKSGPESIEIMAWNKATVIRAAKYLGYHEIQSCKKIWPGINEAMRRKALKCRMDARNDPAMLRSNVASYCGSDKA